MNADCFVKGMIYMQEAMMPAVEPSKGVVSFDLWMTLIRNDGRRFKDARNVLLGGHLVPNYSCEEFDVIMRAVDKQADGIAESRGADVMFRERVEMLAAAVDAEVPNEESMRALYARQGELFKQMPPVLLDPTTPELFDRLKAAGYQLAAMSNTGFMLADQMRPALDQLGIGQKFDYQVFSSEVGYAKPDKRIFEHLLRLTGTTPDNIIHVGDNPRADVGGATSMGMRAILLDESMPLRTIVEELCK